ncbi:toxin-antitoxin system HicB family antitoxin [Candidatus Parcubacteria bacterium]|nr:MAG: toxin-antitoxin system HicB family antitoxin [Candidatus Parcubacteria bacterium]
MDEKLIEKYLALPYRIEVFRDADEENPGWVARVAEWPGCITQADTFEELGEMIEDAMRAWLEVALERGIPIPEPRLDEEFSGKFVVRVPKSLHRKLVEEAKRQGVSLNQYINTALSAAVSGTVGRGFAASSLEDENWPGLSSVARQVMRNAGLDEEVEDADSRLFADWMENRIHMIESAFSHRYYLDALNLLRETASILMSNASHHPVLGNLLHMLALVEAVIDAAAKAVPVDHELLKTTIQAMIAETGQRYVLISETKEQYSQESTEPEISHVDKLFRF